MFNALRAVKLTTSVFVLALLIVGTYAVLPVGSPRSASAAGIQCGAAIADLWFGNDESGSVDSSEFNDALDFMYQISDSFNYNSVSGVQAGAFAWDTSANNVIIPITEDFADTDDSGLIQDSNIVTDGDSRGVRELYTSKAGGGGTNLTVATQHMASIIDAGNGRRNGVLQVAVILTDASESQLTGDAANWITAGSTLRDAGEGNVGIVLVLIAEAATAYNTGSAKTTVDAVAGTGGLVVTVPTYADAADPTQSYVDDVVAAVCEKATPDVDPSLAKTAVFNDENNDGLAQPGETISYTYSVTNPSEKELIDISVTEKSSSFTGSGTLPTPVYVSGDEDVDGDGDAPDLAFNSSGSVTFSSSYTLTQADVDQGSVTSQATATATDLLGNNGSDDSDDTTDTTNVDNNADGEPDDPTVVPLTQSARIQLTKKAQLNGLPLDGATIDYTFTVKNLGNVTLANISISDSLLTVPGVLASLAPGAQDTTSFSASYTVTPADLARGYVENSATVTASDPASNAVNDVSDAGSESIETANGDGTTNGNATDDPTIVPLKDNDNISDEEENGAPNNGDNNNDGLKDSAQSDVTTAVNPIVNGYTTTAVSGDCSVIDSVNFYRESNLDVNDPDYEYPFGLHGFEVDCTVVGGSVDVTYYWDQEYDVTNWNYRKFIQVSGQYVDFNDQVTYGTAVIDGKTVTTVSYSVTDGGEFDGDGVANGRIVDPAGPTTTEVLAETGQSILPLQLSGAALIIVSISLIGARRKNKNTAEVIA